MNMRWKNIFDLRTLVIVITFFLILGALSAVPEGAGTSETEVESSDSLLSNDDEVKDKTFYMYRVEDAVEVGGRTTKEMYNTTYPERRGNETELTEFRELIDWYLFPQLAGELRLNGTSTLSVWGRARDETPPSATFGYELWEVNETDEELIEENEVGRDLDTEWSTYDIPLEIDETHTVSEGSSLRITLDIWGDSQNAYQVAYGGYVEDEDGNDFMADTNVTLPCLDYMRVSNVHTEDHEGEERNLFDPEAQNKNISMHASVTDPFGGYNIEWVNITLEGPDETIFENHTMDQTYGYFDSYESGYEYLWNYTDMPEGVYNITVRAVDKNGMIAYERTDEFQDHEEYGEHSFVIGGLDHYVNLRLRDDQGELLTDTKVNLKISEDVTFLSNETDEEGIVNFTVAEASYMITVDWQDIEVSTNRTIDVGETGDIDREDPFELSAGIYYSSVQILDREEQPVEDANVYMIHPNGTTAIEPMETDEDGEIHLERYAEGDYTFQVDWKGRDVGSPSIEIHSSELFSLNVDIYHLDIIIEDREGDPVNNALLISSYEDTRIVADSTLSDDNGAASLRLPATEYHFEVLWNDATVYEDTYELEDTTEETLTADIFAVTVEVQDNTGKELAGASVTATYERTDKEIATEETFEDGEVEFQLAEGEHRFEVEWFGVEVADVTRTVEVDSTELEISASVHQVEILPRDSTEDQNVLEGASVEIYIDGRLAETGTTDQNGVYTASLPETVIDIRVEWQGIEVYEDQHDIDGYVENEDTVTITDIDCDVYYLHSEIVDSDGDPLENARVDMMHQEELLLTERTDEYGERTFRLPEAEYEIRIIWQDSDAGLHTVEVAEEDSSETLEADVHDLRVKIEGSEEPIEGVRVTLIKDGEALMTERTDEEGLIEFEQVVGGDYEINVRYRTTQHWTSIDIEETEDINLQESHEEVMRFEEYPKPLYRTNLFYLVSALLIIIASGVIVVAMKKEVL